ncbi:hypothetical protein SBRCBS47491_001110 [Sporothrix bragantina]|uniref:TauD/TfdA-like domain-containing protein n=1 Tax=Sporothrix bragantina TaxID=671064 RepID=A0ABP0AVV0_9PEZI
MSTTQTVTSLAPVESVQNAAETSVDCKTSDHRGPRVQLSTLAPAQLNDLALLAAERGVVVFYDQDFADIGQGRQLAYGQHFSRLHVHQMGRHVKDYPALLPVYRDFTAGAIDHKIK